MINTKKLALLTVGVWMAVQAGSAAFAFDKMDEFKKLELSKDQVKQIREIKQKAERDIEVVLTPEQRVKFKEMKKEHMESRKSHMQKSMLNHLDKKLSLSDDQKVKITAILGEFQGNMDRQKRDEKIESVLTDEQKVKFSELKKEMDAKKKEWMEKNKK